MSSRGLRILGIGAMSALLAGCVTYPDSYYYADDGARGDYYYSEYEPSGGYTSSYYDDDSWWPYYSTVLYPVYSVYYDPWYQPGFYYGVTYYPNYRYTSYYSRHYHRPYTFAYAPYRYSWWDNYYDWGGYGWGGYYGGYYGYYYNDRHRHHGDRDSYGGADWRRPSHGGARYGSARNEAERMAHRDGLDRTNSRDYLPREADQRRRQGGYYADGYREPVSGADPTIGGGRPSNTSYGQGVRQGRLPQTQGESRPVVRENYGRPYDRARDYGDGGTVDRTVDRGAQPGMRYDPSVSREQPARDYSNRRREGSENLGAAPPLRRPLGSATPTQTWSNDNASPPRDQDRYERMQERTRRFESNSDSPPPQERAQTRDWSTRSSAESRGGWSRGNDGGGGYDRAPQRTFEQPRQEQPRYEQPRYEQPRYEQPRPEPQRSYEPQRSEPEPRSFDRGGFDRGGGRDHDGGSRGQVERMERSRDRQED